ncbi:MAG: BolA family transcriptional regulator [Candidatus Eremiobacteraeota bacterium]|uniref:Transcriptional regulator BolA n=1 Tax=mine drainage metagenome TaxID=410659 RepID=E6Q0H5_9ZZZZ|nr:BolA family transcriptional regulator [Candidatus Eremiobacteraeota bacterium]
MIDNASLTALVRAAMPDALVAIHDRTGTMDHFNVEVTSAAFAGLNPLDRHRLVYRALDAALKDGRIHALEITTKLPENEHA